MPTNSHFLTLAAQSAPTPPQLFLRFLVASQIGFVCVKIPNPSRYLAAQFAYAMSIVPSGNALNLLYSGVMRLFTFLLVLTCAAASAQIVVKVNDAAALTISPADLAKLPRHTAVLSDHGKQISYEGMLMHDVLAKGGVDFGKELHGKQLSSYVAAVATDGYEVVYALAEFDSTVMESEIIIADKRDGGPLAANEGTFRIVVPHDKRPTRSLRMLQELDIVQLKK